MTEKDIKSMSTIVWINILDLDQNLENRFELKFAFKRCRLGRMWIELRG